MLNNPDSEQLFTGIPGSPGVIHAPLFSFSHGEVEVPRYTVSQERKE